MKVSLEKAASGRELHRPQRYSNTQEKKLSTATSVEISRFWGTYSLLTITCRYNSRLPGGNIKVKRWHKSASTRLEKGLQFNRLQTHLVSIISINTPLISSTHASAASQYSYQNLPHLCHLSSPVHLD